MPADAANQGWDLRPKTRTDWLVWAAIGLATILGFLLAYLKYHNFEGETNDVTVFAYAFAGTMEGRWLPLYYIPGTLLGNHLNLIVLLWLPFFFVWRTFYSLFFFQSAILAVSAWPLYLLARSAWRNERAAALLALTFLLFPTIASQHVNQIHDDQFALPFILFAFVFFARADLRRFLICCLLACLAKETIAVTVAAFGIYALFERRRWPWVVLPLVGGAVYFLIAVKLLATVLAGAGGVLYAHTTYFQAYGNSPLEVIRTFISRPGFVLATMFDAQKSSYLAKLLLPVLYLLPFLSSSVLVSLPNLLLNLIGSNSAFIVIPWHYNVILGGTLLAATVGGVQRMARWLRKDPAQIAIPLTAVTLLCSTAGTAFWYHSADYQPQPHQKTLEQVVSLIPAQATVLCPTPMLAHFSNRPKVNSAYSIFLGSFKDPRQLTDYEYLVLDGNWRSYEALGQQPLVEALRARNDYRLILNENNVFLLQRIPAPAH